MKNVERKITTIYGRCSREIDCGTDSNKTGWVCGVIRTFRCKQCPMDISISGCSPGEFLDSIRNRELLLAPPNIVSTIIER